MAVHKLPPGIPKIAHHAKSKFNMLKYDHFCFSVMNNFLLQYLAK